MSAVKPTPATPARKTKLVWLALFRPGEFEKAEAEDARDAESGEDDNESRLGKIRKALAESFLISISAVILGVLIGIPLSKVFHAGAFVVLSAIAAGVGAFVLLWGTLAVRGWDIQSWSGTSLSERVNQWIFRAMYWFGTMMLTLAATLGLISSWN